LGLSLPVNGASQNASEGPCFKMENIGDAKVLIQREEWVALVAVPCHPDGNAI